MRYMSFLVFQFLSFSTLIVLNIYLDEKISKPFTYEDFLAICIGLPILILVFSIAWKLFSRFPSIKMAVRIALLLPAAMLSILFIGFIEQVLFNL